MDSIQEPFDKVVKRQKTLSLEVDSIIDEMISNLSSISASSTGTTKPQVDAVKKLSSKLSDSAKDFQGILGKCSKAVEKKFKTDLDSIWNPRALDGKVSDLRPDGDFS